MDNKIEVNYAEYEKQRKESILKGGKYVKFELILEHSGDTPYCDLQCRRIDGIDIAKFLLAMETTLEKLKEKHKSEYILGKSLFGVEARAIDVDKNDKDE